jgi:hypothetical protein
MAVTPLDLYMQFFDMAVRMDPTDSTDLTEAVKPTGISIRGKLAFLVHLIEWSHWFDGATNVIHMALSTRQGLTVMPSNTDDGVLGRCDRQVTVTTTGGHSEINPVQMHYLPPIPFAAPQLSLYTETLTDVANLRGDFNRVRLGFTTTPLTAAMYTEIAETWGW